MEALGRIGPGNCTPSRLQIRQRVAMKLQRNSMRSHSTLPTVLETAYSPVTSDLWEYSLSHSMIPEFGNSEFRMIFDTGDRSTGKHSIPGRPHLTPARNFPPLWLLCQLG